MTKVVNENAAGIRRICERFNQPEINIKATASIIHV